jgi:hypothetical protein
LVFAGITTDHAGGQGEEIEEENGEKDGEEEEMWGEAKSEGRGAKNIRGSE